MVSSSDIKYYKTSISGSLGGPISATEIISATSNNLHDTVSRLESVAGDIEYRCFYVKNTHGTETIKDVDVFLKADNPSSERSRMEWGLEYNPNGYKFGPFLECDGSTTFDSTPDDPAYDISGSITVAAWFKTSNDYSGAEGVIVAKGGLGSDTSGQNDNYSIRMTTTNKISVGFEETNGTDHYATSPLTYNDGLWHFVVYVHASLTDTISLFIDDMTTAVAVTSSVTQTPETNAHPVVIARNSRVSDRFFNGEIDEVRIWNRAAGTEERKQMILGSYLSNGLVFQKPFGTNNGSNSAQIIINSSTAPVGVTWSGVTNGPVGNTPNIGSLGPAGSIPVWTKRINQAGAEDAEDDYAMFQVNGKIETAGSGGAGDDDDGTSPDPDWTAFTFAIAGDFDANSTTEDVVEAIRKVNPKIVISAGDNQYDDPPSSGFFDVIEPIDNATTQFETTFGNHDNAESESNSSESENKSHFGYTDTYNKFTVQNVLFITIDNTTETDFQEGSTQWNKVKGWLDDARKSTSTIDWIVCVIHKPMFGAASQHDYNDDDFNDAFGPLFNTYKVDLVVGGHNHNWQITKQVKFDSGDVENPDVVDASSPYVGGEGFLHAVSGTGGHDSGNALYSLGTQPSFQAYQSRDYNGFLKGVLSNNNKTLTVSFVAEDGSEKYSAVVNR